MIIDTLVIIVCLMVDTPRIKQADIPVSVRTENRFTRSFQQADSVFEAASLQAMQEALYETRFERYRALGIISYEDYRFLKQGEKELEGMKELKRK